MRTEKRMKRLTSVGELELYRNKILAQEDEAKTRVNVCMTGCRAYGAAEVRDAFVKWIRPEAMVQVTQGPDEDDTVPPFFSR